MNETLQPTPTPVGYETAEHRRFEGGDLTQQTQFYYHSQCLANLAKLQPAWSIHIAQNIHLEDAQKQGYRCEYCEQPLTSPAPIEDPTPTDDGFGHQLTSDGAILRVGNKCLHCRKGWHCPTAWLLQRQEGDPAEERGPSFIRRKFLSGGETFYQIFAFYGSGSLLVYNLESCVTIIKFLESHPNTTIWEAMPELLKVVDLPLF